MKKNVLAVILASVLLMIGSIGTVRAEILPPRGEGQMGYQAVVLCESITVRKERSASSKAVQTLPYGKVFSVLRQSGGWAEIILSDDVDASPAGWVNADYIAIDPAWYKTGDKTPVYAWNDSTAPKVAMLDKNTTLPILKEDGNWLLVSLRGAAGWIRRG